MGVDLRLYIVKKQLIEDHRAINPQMVMQLQRRSDLFDLISEYQSVNGKILTQSIYIDFENQEVSIDKYDNNIYYVDCKGLSQVILNYDEKFRDRFEFFVNDIIANTLTQLDEQFVCVLYWC